MPLFLMNARDKAEFNQTLRLANRQAHLEWAGEFRRPDRDGRTCPV